MKEEERNNISKAMVIGALLHDIGKFKMRGMISREGMNHSEIGKEWIKSKEELGLDPKIKLSPCSYIVFLSFSGSIIKG